MPIILALAQALPYILQAGAPLAASLLEHVTKTSVPTSGVEQFAYTAISAIGPAIALGKDVTEDAKRLREQLSAMQAENRGPTDAEWADQARRIAAKDGRLDAAAARTV